MPPGANHRLVSNERLEFLGDAILGAIVCDLLFRKFPEYLEGELTKIKSIVVSRHTCAKISQDLGDRRVPGDRQRDGITGSDAGVGAGGRVREPDRGDLSGRRDRSGAASSSSGTSSPRSTRPSTAGTA